MLSLSLIYVVHNFSNIRTKGDSVYSSRSFFVHKCDFETIWFYLVDFISSKCRFWVDSTKPFSHCDGPG